MANLTITQGDITVQHVDAIVNAANTSLAGGGGVDGAINAASGPRLIEASHKLAPCPTGEARITPGFKLAAKFVIHTVGPIYGMADGREAELLASCYRSSLNLAMENGVRTIAFPSISTGVFGYPIELAAPIAIQTVQQWLVEHPDLFDEVRFVLHSPADYKIYKALVPY